MVVAEDAEACGVAARGLQVVPKEIGVADPAKRQGARAGQRTAPPWRHGNLPSGGRSERSDRNSRWHERRRSRPRRGLPSRDARQDDELRAGQRGGALAQDPHGKKWPLPNGARASRTTMSRSRARRRCWKPSSRRTTPAPAAAAQRAPSIRSAPTTTMTPEAIARGGEGSSPQVLALTRGPSPVETTSGAGPRSASIPAADDGGDEAVRLEMAGDPRDERRLSGASYGQVSDADHRKRRATRRTPRSYQAFRRRTTPANAAAGIERVAPATGRPPPHETAPTGSDPATESTRSAARPAAPRLAARNSRPDAARRARASGSVASLRPRPCRGPRRFRPVSQRAGSQDLEAISATCCVRGPNRTGDSCGQRLQQIVPARQVRGFRRRTPIPPSRRAQRDCPIVSTTRRTSTSPADRLARRATDGEASTGGLGRQRSSESLRVARRQEEQAEPRHIAPCRGGMRRGRAGLRHRPVDPAATMGRSGAKPCRARSTAASSRDRRRGRTSSSR